MRTTERLLDQLNRAFGGEAWHGPALRNLLDGVTEGQAKQHPIAGAHSIFDLALHARTWIDVVAHRIAAAEETMTTVEDWSDGAGATWADTIGELERAESRLRLIDQALARVENGTYGICVDCGDEIGLERLKVLPFAVRCVDCESRRSRSDGATSRLAEGVGQWTPPPDMNEVDSEEREREAPDDLTVVSSESAFDVEPEEQEDQPAPRTRGRRGRPRST